MRATVSLTCVVKSYIYMTHGSCRRYAKGRTPQPGLGTAAARGSAGGRRGIGAALRHFQTAGLPLSANGRGIEGAVTHRRCQDPLHGEAFAELGPAASPLRQNNRVNAQRDCQPGFDDGPTSRARAWLRAALLEASAWNINSIVCWKRSWPRCFKPWRRPSVVLLAQSRKPRRP